MTEVIVTKSKIDAIADAIESKEKTESYRTNLTLDGIKEKITNNMLTWENIACDYHQNVGLYGGEGTNYIYDDDVIINGNGNSLGSYAFYCAALKGKLTFYGTALYKYALYCSRFTELELPNVYSIDSETLNGMYNLTSLTLPNLKNIEDNSMGGAYISGQGQFEMKALKTISFGENVTLLPSGEKPSTLFSLSLSVYNSYYFPVLESIYLKYPFVITNDTYINFTPSSSYTYPTIYVPSSLVDAYKTATNWSTMADYIKGY